MISIVSFVKAWVWHDPGVRAVVEFSVSVTMYRGDPLMCGPFTCEST